MVLSRRQFAYLYYLEVYLTVLQNYRITAFFNPRLTPLKCQKMKQQQQQLFPVIKKSQIGDY